MPNRILKDSICRSDTIDQLTWFEEVLFYRLIVACDDHGLFDGRPAIIKGTCFPLKDVTNKAISDALNKLSTVGLVRGYEVQGRPYLQLVSWDRHQQIRAHKTKYPKPDSNGYQLISDDISCARNPIQSESNPNPIQTACACDRFSEFAAAYPKPGADAYGVGIEYVNTIRSGVSAEDLIQAAKNYAEYCRITETEERYILNAENFLRKMAFDRYLPGKYKKPEKRRKGKTEQYNQFMQNTYDFDKLEKALLGEKDG